MKKGPFDSKVLKSMIVSILNALVYIHSKGIIHRDLKLDNILNYKQNDFKDLRIIDFGLS